jgi:hypothetical protein
MRLKPALIGGLALLLLQSVAALPFPYSFAAHASQAMRASPDLVTALAIAGLAAAVGWSRAGAIAGAILIVVTTLLRAFDDLVPAVFGRSLEWTDVDLLPGIWHLLTNELSPGWRMLWGIVTVTALLALHGALAWALHRLARPSRRHRRAWWLGLGASAAVIALLPASARQRCMVGPASRHFVQAITDLVDPTSQEQVRDRRIASGAAALTAAPQQLAAVRDIDVHFLILESYGAFARRHPAVAPRLERRWQASLAALSAHGFAVQTMMLRPTIAGGSSWLAHLELFAAFPVVEQRTWERALERPSQPTLPKTFAAAGHHTVEVMPAMNVAWPAGDAFYGFAQTLYQHELAYRGHVYPFGLMSDQFALQRLLHDVVLPAKQPLFTSFVSTTSHAPWTAVPPYIDDWRAGPSACTGPPAIEHATTVADLPRGPALEPAYADSIDYALRTALGFIAELPRPSLVLVLGDHQPPHAAGMEPPDRTRDVPVHALSNRPELLARLEPIGFRPGYALPAEALPLAEFAPALLQALAAPLGR